MAGVQRDLLRAYSPVHNVRAGVQYPPTLVVTGDQDERVPPGVHSYKFTAALQSVGACALLRVEQDAGHGSGKRRSADDAERADVLSFIDAALER